MAETTQAQLPVLTLARAAELLDECVQERGADYSYLPVEVTPEGRPVKVQNCYYVHTAVQQQDAARSSRDCGMDAPDVPDDAPPVPGCLIGLALHKHGVPLDRMTWVTGASDLLYDLQQDGVLDFEKGVSNLFDDAQFHQDSGKTWGDAVDKAVTRMNLVARP